MPVATAGDGVDEENLCVFSDFQKVKEAR